MATLYVSEFAGISGNGGGAQVALGFQKANNVAIGGSSTASAVFGPGTQLIRVHTDAICSIEISSTPVAALTSMRMAADQTEYFAVSPNQKISVIANT